MNKNEVNVEGNNIQTRAQNQEHPEYIPKTDIYEKDKDIVLVVEMPGVDKNGFDIVLEDGTLTISGTQHLCEPGGYELLHRGFVPVIYHRSFNLLTEVDQDRITAEIKNGLLKIILPKAKDILPKKVEINVG